MKKICLVSIMIVVCLAAVSCGRSDSKPAAPPSAEIGAPASDFMLRDLTGKEVSLSSYRGKVVLLEFWATWCPPCKAAVPDLIAVHRKFHDKGFTVVGISMDTDSNAALKVTDFSSAHNINYPVLLADETVAQSYGVISIPASYLIDREGRITAVHMGYTADYLNRVSAEIEKLL